jgi:SAM-dependent methyltransferase
MDREPWSKIGSGKMMTHSDAAYASDAQQIARYWENPGRWSETLNDLDRVRIPRTLDMIPHDVRSIAEVGCGNGRVSNRLVPNYFVVGLDVSRTALKQAAARRVMGSGSYVPLARNSVDLVLCTDVLEHLPDEMMRETAREMVRISKRYVLVGVPYRERYQAAYARCSVCGLVANGFGHLRSFTERVLDGLFAGCEVLATDYVGGPRKYFNPVLLWIEQRLAGTYWGAGVEALCIGCGNNRFDTLRRTLIQKAIAKVSFRTNELLDAAIPERWKPQHEIVRLYRIRNATTNEQ